MINEDRIKAAAAELSLCQIQSLTAPEDEHTFSPRFERKMKRLLRKVDDPVKHLFMNVAAVFLAVLLAAGALLLFSPSVRALMTKWILTYSDGYVSCYHNGGAKAQKFQYIIRELPDGYQLERVMEEDNGVRYMYCSSDGKIMSFSCYDGSEEQQVHFYSPDAEHFQVQVGEYTADVFITPSKEEHNTIVWIDQDAQLLFSIHYYGGLEEMVRMAESVTLKK